MLGYIRRALERGIIVKIYISGKALADQHQTSSSWSAVRELDHLMEKFPNLHVKFLADRKRAFFEVAQDQDHPVISNEPSLSTREFGPEFRPFAGVAVTIKSDISSYFQSHLSAETLSVIESPALRPIRAQRRQTLKQWPNKARSKSAATKNQTIRGGRHKANELKQS